VFDVRKGRGSGDKEGRADRSEKRRRRLLSAHAAEKRIPGKTVLKEGRDGRPQMEGKNRV